MAQAKIQFSEHADFPFKDYIKAVKALTKTPRVYGVSLPVEAQSDDLKKKTDRVDVLYGYLKDFPDYADKSDWESEIHRLNNGIGYQAELYNEDLKAKSQEFFDEIKACGCDLTAQYTPQIGAESTRLAPESKTASCDFVGTEVPQFIADNHDVKIIEIQLNKMPAAQRRILVDGTSVFLKKLGAYLSDIKSLKDSSGYAVDYVRELMHHHHTGKADVLENMPVEYKGGDSNALNASGTKRLNDLANLGVFKDIDVVRAVLMTQAFWKKDERAKNFLETLDALVDTGLMNLPEKQWRHKPFEPLIRLYDEIRPFDKRDTKRTYVKKVDIEIEGENKPLNEWSYARKVLEQKEQELEEVKGDPDFKKQVVKLEHEIKIQKAVVENLSTQHSDFSNNKDAMRAEIAEHERADIEDDLKRMLSRRDFEGLSLSFGDVEMDISVGSSYKMDAIIQATAEQMQKINPNDNYWSFRLQKSPSEADGFDAKAFVEFVNDPSQLKTKDRPHGVTDNMLAYFKSRDPLVFSVKHMTQKP